MKTSLVNISWKLSKSFEYIALNYLNILQEKKERKKNFHDVDMSA